MNEPDLLFLDEPTTGLDPQSRRDLHADILKMRKEGRTVVLTTHYIEEAHVLCDRVAIIDHGKVIAIGKPDELIKASQGDNARDGAGVHARWTRPCFQIAADGAPRRRHERKQSGRARRPTTSAKP